MKAASARIPTLAVLPFENLGGADDEYFADGMTEELTSRLAKLSGLAVIARTSAIQYKKTTKSIPQIARELGADFLIEGTVRWEKESGRAGRVRITPQVVRAKDGTHVWAERYDKPYGSGIFEMQSEIAERVADALSVTLLAGEQKAVRAVPTKNLQAYDHFLRGQAYSARDLGNDWDAERLALENYQQATKLDPTFALAHAWVATTHAWMALGTYDWSLPTGVTHGQRLELAREAAERAIALDPDLPRAHSVLAQYYSYGSRDTTRAMKELDLALRGDPSDPQAVTDRGWALFYRGKRAEGIRDLERAAALDPRNAGRLLNVEWGLWMTRDYRAAEEYLDRAIALSPDAPRGYVLKTWINVWQGRVEQAHATLREGARQVGMGKLLFGVAQEGNLMLLRILFLDDEYGRAARQLSWETFGVDSVDYYLTKAIAYRREPERASTYYDSLAAWAEPRVRRGGEARPVYPLIWAIGLAGSGKRAAAVTEINRILADNQYDWDGSKIFAAEACVLVSLYECAIEKIRAGMTEPLEVSPQVLKLDPIWDPLRGRADFQKLVEAK